MVNCIPVISDLSLMSLRLPAISRGLDSPVVVGAGILVVESPL